MDHRGWGVGRVTLAVSRRRSDLAHAPGLVVVPGLHLLGRVDVGLRQDPRGRRTADPVDVGNRDFPALLSRQIDSGHPVPEATWEVVPAAEQVEPALQDALTAAYGFVVGSSPSLHEVCRWIRAVANQVSVALDLRTLVVGGRTLVLRADVEAFMPRPAGRPKGASR